MTDNIDQMNNGHFGELWFHPTLWPTAINDEIARGVYARTGLADNVDQVVGLGGRTLIGTQTEKW